MLRLDQFCSILLLSTTIARAQPGQGDPADVQARMQSMTELRQLAQAVIMYASEQRSMPGSVKTLFDRGILAPGRGTPSEDGASLVINGVVHPYLGLEGVSMSEVPDWGDIAIAHRSLEHAFPAEPTPDNPEGAIVSIVFLDGHVEMVSPAEARWLIEESSKTLAAIRDGAPLPMYRQVEQDAARLAQAMRSFADRNQGIAPRDWASTFEFLRLNEPDAAEANLLKIYLAPRARDTTFIPQFDRDEERHAWINANSMWESHAHGANLWHVPNPMFTALLSARSDAWVLTPDRRLREHVRRVAFAMVDTRSGLVDREVIEARARHAEVLFDAIREGAPLPPLDDAMHDLKVLSLAIAAYAKDNDGYLPGDLGELVPHLQHLWGVHEREPARVFLVRDDESPALTSAKPDDDWVRTHCSYVYLGDPTVRLSDLRGTQASILLHAPLDRPFEIESPLENDKRVPFAGPPVGLMLDPADGSSLPMYLLPSAFLEEQAKSSREAIEALIQR